MSYPPQQPAPFLPPSAPRRSRGGGWMLVIAGLLGGVAVFLPLVSFEGQSMTLKEFADIAEELGLQGLDSPHTWFIAALAGAGIAFLFGLIGGIAGSKGANVTAGVFGLLATVALAYPPVWLLTGDSLPSLSDIIDVVAIGYYLGALAALLALVGAITAFVGSGKN